MAEGKNEASFAINLEGNAPEVSSEMASEMEKLRAKISGGTDSIRQMQSAMKSLRGTSAELTSARTQLKAKIDAERTSVSAANLALLKQGTTYEKLAASARKAATEKAKLDAKLESERLAQLKAKTDAASNALHATGGPVAELTSRFGALKGILGGTGGSMGALTLLIAGTVAAITALTVAAIAAGAALVRFVVFGADAARSLQLAREAFTGSAQNARNLGTQVDALAGKVATSKEKLNDLANQLTRSRLSGNALVDTFNLVGQASEAMGDEVGNQLRDIVTRSQITQRIQINPLELQGTGLKFQDIAGDLAKQMHVGVKDAQAALFEGRVKLDDGAKALRAAVEKRFAEINARKLLSLDVQLAKFKERLGALTSDVDVEPLLKGFAELQSLFDSSTVSGATLKSLITIIGNGLGGTFKAVLPIAKGFIKGLIIGALDVGIAYLTLRNQFRKTFGDRDVLGGIDKMKVALTAAKFVVYAVATGLAISAAAVGLLVVAIGSVVKAFRALVTGAQDAWEYVSTIDWGGLGESIVNGIVTGLTGGAGIAALKKAMTGLASTVKGAFAEHLGIHSPSKVFAGYGRNTAEGYAEGVDEGAPGASAAVERMAPSAPAGGGGGGRAGAPVNLTVNINVTGGGNGADVAKQLSEPSFLAQLTKTIEDALLGAAIPTQGAPAS